MVGVYYYWAAAMIYLFSSNCFVNANKDCPEICHCLGYYVDCASNKLETVPSNLPKWTTHLDLHNNSIKKLNDPIWRNLTVLTQLKLSKNDITVIPNDAFSYQKNLKVLELNRNRLQYIYPLTFKSLEYLTVLKLKRNHISELKDGAFYGLRLIDKLILDYNFVEVISKRWLYGLKTLKEFSLSHNNVSNIENDSWEFCPQLRVLDLSFNKLVSIESNTFKHLGDLQKLVLNNNNITFIEEFAFSHLFNLKILHLNNNKIFWTIEDANGVYQGLGNLMKLHLAGNEIKSINRNAFIGLKSVIHLNLDNNNITSIQKNAFLEVPLLSGLIMNTTSLICDCNLKWFYDWLATKKFKTHTVCAYPEWLRGQSLLDMPISNFTCDELPKPRLTQQPEPEIMALKGENISLSCTAMSSSNSIMKFQWKKDNVELHNVKVQVRTNTDGKNTETTSTLNIHNVQHSNGGRYQCVVSNVFGTTYSQKSFITVLIFPTFKKIPVNVTAQAGATAHLECGVDGEPQPEIAWQKDGGNDFPAARERRMHVMPTDDVFFIINVKPSDMGVYSCTAHNAAGTIVANASLTVQEKPSFVKPMENKEVTAGNTVVLECKYNGTPRPTVKWMKDAQPLKTTERHFLTAEDQLMVIIDTIISDSGLYECHINNSLGHEIGTSLLRVKSGQIAQTSTKMGIFIITVVCCAVATSIVWVVIIYQTRKRMSSSSQNNSQIGQPQNDGQIIDFIDQTTIHFNDNTSDHSSCKDSGTGDSAKRSNDDLVPDEFTLVINDEEGWQLLKNASLVYINSGGGGGENSFQQTHTPLLHNTNNIRLTNHDRAITTTNDDDDIEEEQSQPEQPKQAQQQQNEIIKQSLSE